MVKRQIVYDILERVRKESKKNAESPEDYVARVNNEFYPAYRDIIEVISILIEADPKTLQLTDELCEKKN